MYDLLIKGGTVIDAAQGLNNLRDVAIASGKVAAIESAIGGDAKEVVDATGLIVTPGLIDMHMHAYWGVCCYGLEPDAINIAKGVTTAMDCGSAGARTFPHFRRTVIERVDTRLYALLNISAMGIISPVIGELYDMRWARVEDAGNIGIENRDLVLGIKVRLSHHTIFMEDKLDALKRAIAAAEMFGGMVMVHVGDIETPLETLTKHLRPGDVITHAFRQWGGVVSADRVVVDEIRDAQKNGIIFDVGHGGGSCSFDTIETALAQGFYPDTISSDVSTLSVEGPVIDLVTTMSKFLHFGIPIEDVIRLTTQAPAEKMGLGNDLGSLKIGTTADVSILSVDDGEYTFMDAERKSTSATRKINSVKTVKAGKVYRDWDR
jgi:dihydroorotase